jgi:hypothetical protein
MHEATDRTGHSPSAPVRVVREPSAFRGQAGTMVLASEKD